MAGRPGWGPCSGRLDRAHLIPKQRIKRELRSQLTPSDLHLVVWDERVVIPACRHHHGQLDAYIHRLSRDELPAATEDFAREHGLVWSLMRDYK